MPSPESIDPRIAQASTLPGEFYSDRTVYERLLELGFVPSWQWLGHADELPRGHARPLQLLAGSIDEPLLLLRDPRGELRCLSNVCTHRGARVQRAAGACERLRCGYHGRQFELDGAFKHMPHFEGAEGFPRPADDLPQLPLHSVCNALFTSLAPQTDFESWVEPMTPLLEALPQAQFAHDPARSKTFEVEAHWALYLDNYLEGFHIPYVHPGLREALVDEHYVTRLFPAASLQVGRARPGATAFEPAQTLPGEEGPVAAYYYWLFPGTLFNFYPWGLSLNVLEPLGLARTRVHFHSYVWRPELLETGAGANLGEVQGEDERVVAEVQAGMGSRLYTRGRFSPTREQGVHHFQRCLAQLLAGM